MKHSYVVIILVLIFSILTTSYFQSQIEKSIPYNSIQNSKPFEGMWLREMDSMVLFVVDYKNDSFAFVMRSYLSGYFGFMGGSDGDLYKYAKIINDCAYFNDAGAYSDGRPLYYEGEEPCELRFRFLDSETIEIKQENTCGVYGGHGAYWWGRYQKFHNDEILNDLKDWSSIEY